MKINVITGNLDKTKTELLVIGQFEDEQFTNKELDGKLKNTMSNSIKEKKFNGEFKQLFVTSTFGLIDAQRVLLIGLGKKKDFNLEKLRRVAGVQLKLHENPMLKNLQQHFLTLN